MKQSIIIVFVLVMRNADAQSFRDKWVYFPNLTVNEGTVIDKGEHFFNFPFQNVTNHPIKVLAVRSSCGCLVGKSQKRQVEPGAWDTIQGQLYTIGRLGYTSKTLTLELDQSKKRYVLSLFIHSVPYLPKLSIKAFNGLKEIERDTFNNQLRATFFSDGLFVIENIDTIPQNLKLADNPSEEGGFSIYFSTNTDTFTLDVFANNQSNKNDKKRQEVTLLPKEKVALVFQTTTKGSTRDFIKMFVNENLVTIEMKKEK